MYVHLSEDIKVVDEVTNTNAVPARLYTHIQTDRHTDIQTVQHASHSTDRQSHRQTHRQTDTHRDSPVYVARDSQTDELHAVQLCAMSSQ